MAGKIILIIVLVLVGLAVLAVSLICLFLFGPIRYHLDMDSDGTYFAMSGRTSMLKPIYTARIAVEAGKYKVKARFLGISLKKDWGMDLLKFLYRKLEEADEKKEKTVKSEERTVKEEGPEAGAPGFSGFQKHGKRYGIAPKGKGVLKKLKRFLVKMPAFFRSLREDIRGGEAVLKYLLRLLKVLLPEQYQVSLSFGFEDPSVTGQVMGALSMATAFLADGGERVIELKPDFAEACFGADGKLNGCFNVFKLLKVLVPAALDKDVEIVLNKI